MRRFLIDVELWGWVKLRISPRREERSINRSAGQLRDEWEMEGGSTAGGNSATD